MCKQQEFKSNEKKNNDLANDFSRFECHFYKNDSKFKLEQPKDFRSPQTIELRMTAAHMPNMDRYDHTEFIDTKSPSEQNEQQFLMEQSIFKYVKTMQDLLAQSNLKRTEIDRVSAEALIEKDFLKKPRQMWMSVR